MSIFHKIWLNDQNLTCEGCFEKEKEFLIAWAMSEGSILKDLAMVWLRRFWINFIKKSALGLICHRVFGIPQVL